MFRRIAVLITYFAILVFFAIPGRPAEYWGMIISPIFTMFLLYFLTPGDKKFAVGAFLLFSAYILVKINTSDMHSYWFLIQGTSVALCAGSFLILHKYWQQDLGGMRARTAETQNTVLGLLEAEKRSAEEQARLEEQANEIVSLFELAREFNECINLKEIIGVLSKQVFSHMPFERGKLVFLDNEILPFDADEAHLLGWGKSKEVTEDTVREMQSDQDMVARLTKRQTPVRFDSAEDDREKLLNNQSVCYPLWIFPLIVGGEVTAAFWVEGAQNDDFGKFEIIASQLALHVKKVKLYNRVRELSINDGLTKLFIRRHFLERFQEELTRSLKYNLSLAVLLLDIDLFKQYNDTYGHLVGDVALRQVAQTITEAIRRVDVAGRYGGEEFAIVLPETDRKGGLDCAERIRSYVAKKVFRAYDEETKLTVSIGLTVFPEDVPGASEGPASEELTATLLKQADKALYHAKEEGRNQIATFDPSWK